MTMKKLMVLLSVSFLLPSVADASWEGEYELDNGAKVTRKPTGLQVQKGGLNLVSKGVHLSKGSNTQGIVPKSDVDLTMDMTPVQFRQQLSKLGRITKATVNPPEAPVAAKKAPVAAKKAPVVKKKVPVAAKKAPVVKKKVPVAAKKAPVVKANSSSVVKKQAKRQALLKRRQARLAAKK